MTKTSLFKPKGVYTPRPQEPKAGTSGPLNLDALAFVEPDKLTPDGEPIETNALDTVLRFLKTPMDIDFKYHALPGDGRNHEQRMRVAVSRLRAKLRDNGREPKSFKMLFISIEKFPTHETVTMRKGMSAPQVMAEEIKQALANLERERNA